MIKKGVRNFFLVSVLLTLTIALGGCAGDKEVGGASSQITIGIPQDVEDSLDPHEIVAAGTREVFFNLFEGLVKPDSKGDLVPAVASDVKSDDDGLVYTFTLRDGIKFHNGNPVTVEDVKYSIDKCADTSDGGPVVEAYSNIESVTILDGKTVEIQLKEANTEFLSFMTAAILPKDNPDPAGNAIGTGPYKFVSHTPQEEFVMEKFEDYWGTPANIELVTFKVLGDADTIVMSLNGGAVDMVARVTEVQAQELSTDFHIFEGNMNLVQGLFLNNAAAPFDDVRVRQALCYGSDAQEILDLISGGKGTVIGSNMFPAFGKYYVEDLDKLYTRNIDKAKELLTEAGLPDGFTFTITVPSNYQQHIDTAQVLAEQYKAIGVNAEIQLIEWESWLSDVYTDRNYQATVIGLDAANLSASALLERFLSEKPNNFISFNSPEYDETIKKAIATTDDEEKTELYRQCQIILTEEAASVYIQDLPEFVALNKKYTGYEFYPLYAQDISKIRPAE